MNIKKSLGKRLQNIRKNKNITQEKLAELVGVETNSISNIENGRYFPSADNLEKIINALGINFSDIFNFDDEFQDVEDMVEEMTTSMKNNKKLTKLMYKIYLSIKYL